MNTKSDILNELMINQRKDVYYAKKMTYKDLNRLIKYVDKSLFGEECCIWKGYVSCPNTDNPNYYINFFFKNKKVGLHRLLYSNFVGEINNNDYIKYICINQGKCCNIRHFVKFSSDNDDDDNSVKYNSDEDNNTDEDNIIEEETIKDNIDDFKVYF